ncbi:MAG: phosphate acyltransferase PlsX [Acidimicrobiia bacterium]
MTRIALDAMGGDRAPTETVAGAVAASAQGVDVVLVGDESAIRDQLTALGSELPVVHAPDVIGMGDEPARAIREKPESSVAVCARMVKEGEADGFVSAGSTGAAMASAAILIGRIEGVLRPTIASVLPTRGTPTIMLDSGANPEVKPEHLLQFGEMGAALAEIGLGIDHPRVALLNIGEEKGKGRPLEKTAYELLANANVEFVGNVEGRDIAGDRTDVIVTDGFTGNVFLKTIEGAGGLVISLLDEALATASAATKEEVMGLIKPIVHRMDYEETGGAFLLGVDGVVVIAHGSSGRRAIANALVMAHEGARGGLVARVASKVTA